MLQGQEMLRVNEQIAVKRRRWWTSSSAVSLFLGTAFVGHRRIVVFVASVGAIAATAVAGVAARAAAHAAEPLSGLLWNEEALVHAILLALASARQRVLCELLVLLLLNKTATPYYWLLHT